MSHIPATIPASKADVSQYLLRHVSSQEAQIVLSYNGPVDGDRLARAVRLAVDAEPVLGCRFFDHWYRPFWQRRDDLDSIDLCSVVPSDDPAADVMKYFTHCAGERTSTMVYDWERLEMVQRRQRTRSSTWLRRRRSW